MAVIFDWRRRNVLAESFGPAGALRQRFPDSVRGHAAWIEFVAALSEGNEQSDWRRSPDAMVEHFFERTAGERLSLNENTRFKRRLFISHRQNDVQLALDVADEAQRRGWDVWLDVLDPQLTIASRFPDDAVRALLLAVIIEMALLNCTHVIALLTDNSKGSAWIPYEFGRAKEDGLHSQRCASLKVMTGKLPEYAWLGAVLNGDTDLRRWLGSA